MESALSLFTREKVHNVPYPTGQYVPIDSPAGSTHLLSIEEKNKFILVVDDKHSLHTLVKTLLRSEGYGEISEKGESINGVIDRECGISQTNKELPCRTGRRTRWATPGAGPVWRKVHRTLKKALDPNGVLAPGKSDIYLSGEGKSK